MKTLEEIKLYAKNNHIPIIREQSSQILQKICSTNKPKQILEIGTAIGYSAILMCEASENCHVTTIEKNTKMVELAKQNINDFNMQNNISLILADAIEVLPTLKERYDLIFLDGPKGQYYKYLPFLLNALSQDGILIADDVLYHGLMELDFVPHKHRSIVVNLKKFINTIKQDEKLECEILNIEDGLLIVKRK